MPLSPDLIARFAAIVGQNHALSDPAEMAGHLEEERGLFHGKTPLLLRPGTAAEVAAIMTLAHERGTPIVPQGGNTGMVGGQIPMGDEVLLSLRRLDRIREIDPTSNALTCEAGVLLATAQQAAAEVDRLFPLSLGSEGSCTVGGNLSTNAGGVATILYGNARELALGLEVVLPDGRIWHGLNKLKKDNTGYDLKDLFIGAEGTLGIITAAVLKLFPRPRSVVTAFVGLSSPHAALELLNLTKERAGGTITSFEIIPRLAIDFALRHGTALRDPLQGKHAWYVLVELSSQMRDGLQTALEDALAAAIDRHLLADAAIATSLDQAGSFWKLRHYLSEAQKPEGGSIKHDVSVPVSAVPAFIDEASTAVEQMIPGCRPVPFGHMGDGNIHFNVSQPLGADKAEYLARWGAMNALVHDIVVKMGGSISAEHGIGRLKRDLLPKVKDPVAMELMRSIKRALDPDSICNPGRVL